MAISMVLVRFIFCIYSSKKYPVSTLLLAAAKKLIKVITFLDFAFLKLNVCTNNMFPIVIQPWPS